MRTLKFKVSGQMLEPDGDFSSLVPGTSGYLQAEFCFDNDWAGCNKAVEFYSIRGKKYGVKLVNNRCEIPEEVLGSRYFKLMVYGARNGYRITTNKLRVIQGG